MPKIMYRPNPVPPPFVPPTPIVPENSISLSPTTFNEGQSVIATLHKVTLTDEIGERNLLISSTTIGSQYINNIPVEPGYNENISIPFVAIFDSDTLVEASIELNIGGDWETELVLEIIP